MRNFQDHPVMVNRLQQILWTFLIGLICAAALTWWSSNSEGVVTNYTTVMLLVGSLALTCVAVMYRVGNRNFATVCMLCTVTIVIIGISWAAGGLNSIGLIAFPIIMLFSAAYAKPKYFFPLFSVLLATTFFFGLNGVYDWFPSPPELFVKGPMRLVGFLLGFCVCGLLVWFVSKDLRFAFNELEHEQLRMTETNKVIQDMADHDALTGLYSYNASMEKYQSMLHTLDVGRQEIVFYFIDLDNFKLVNDIYDHSAGDQLLVLFSQRLLSMVDDDTVVCRIGGDEFALFKLINVGEDINYLSEKLVKLISSENYKVSTASLHVSASVGVSLVKDKQTAFADVHKKADMAMIQAKQSGKNNYHSYSEALEHAYMSNLMMIDGLKQAVALGLLELEFQATIKHEDKRVVGASASLVWKKENPQNYQFNDFWPVIENTEIIHEIGAWMIKQACLSCKSWHDNGHEIVIEVYVSAAQLRRSSFSETVGAILVSAGLTPSKLVLVLPESSFYEDEAEHTEQQINKLEELGVLLAIGGFGNGYSNLSQLTKLKIDALCLDDSLISNVTTSQSTEVVVSAIVDVATELNMLVSTCGVTSKAQVEKLAKLGCQYAAGPYWSPPLSAARLQQFIEDREQQVESLVS